MALIPHVFGNDFWNSWNWPSTLLDQDFGTPLPADFNRNLLPRRVANMLREGDLGFSNVVNDKNNFIVKIDCRDFKPEELTVKQVDNSLTISGKHEEKKDEHGFITREFTRRYLLPKEVHLEQMKSNLNSSGVLTISAPKVYALEGAKERPIPIEHSK